MPPSGLVTDTSAPETVMERDELLGEGLLLLPSPVGMESRMLLPWLAISTSTFRFVLICVSISFEDTSLFAESTYVTYDVSDPLAN